MLRVLWEEWKVTGWWIGEVCFLGLVIIDHMQILRGKNLRKRKRVKIQNIQCHEVLTMEGMGAGTVRHMSLTQKKRYLSHSKKRGKRKIISQYAGGFAGLMLESAGVTT